MAFSNSCCDGSPLSWLPKSPIPNGSGRTPTADGTCCFGIGLWHRNKKKKRSFSSSYLYILFIWQVPAICCATELEQTNQVMHDLDLHQNQKNQECMKITISPQLFLSNCWTVIVISAYALCTWTTHKSQATCCYNHCIWNTVICIQTLSHFLWWNTFWELHSTALCSCIMHMWRMAVWEKNYSTHFRMLHFCINKNWIMLLGLI